MRVLYILKKALTEEQRSIFAKCGADVKRVEDMDGEHSVTIEANSHIVRDTGKNFPFVAEAYSVPCTYASTEDKNAFTRAFFMESVPSFCDNDPADDT